MRRSSVRPDPTRPRARGPRRREAGATRSAPPGAAARRERREEPRRSRRPLRYSCSTLWPTISSTSRPSASGGDAGRCGAPVGEHRHPVADPADLVEAVRDVDDAHAVRRQPADDFEEGLDLALVQDGRRLVHDQQPHVDGQRPRDRDDLLGGRPKRPHLRASRDRRVAEAREQRVRLPVHLVEVEKGPAPRLVRQEDALRDRQVIDQVQLLVDRGHSPLERLRRVTDRKRLAHEQDLAAGGLVRARDALDQRRLAGPVRP